MKQDFAQLCLSGFLLCLTIQIIHCSLTERSVSNLTASFSIHESSVLAMRAKLAIIDLDLKEDMYATEYVLCTPYCKPSSNKTLCDYTDCASVLRRPPTECDHSLCTGTQTDIILEPIIGLRRNVSKMTPVIELERQEARFRWFFNSPCKAFVIRTEIIAGDGRLSFSHDVPSTSWYQESGHRHILSQIRPWSDIHPYCPMNEAYKYGSHFMTVMKRTSAFVFRVGLHIVDIGNKTKKIKEGWQPYQELEDDVPQRYLEDAFGAVIRQYTFKIKGCTLLFGNLELIQSVYTPPGSDAMMGSVAVNIEPVDSLEKRTSHYLFGGDSGSRPFWICPPEGKEEGLVYLETTGLYMAFVQITVATSVDTAILVPLSDYPQHVQWFWLGGGVQLKCGSKYFNCEVWSTQFSVEQCAGFRPLAPSRLPNPFWPPVLGFQHAQFPYYAPPLQDFVKERYQAAAYISISALGTDRYHVNESMVPSCTLEFGDRGFLHTKDRKMFKGSVKLRPSNFTCTFDEFLYLSSKFEGYQVLLKDQNQTNSAFISTSYRFMIDALTFSRQWTSCKFIVDDMLVNASVVVNRTSSICFWERNSENWEKDPCCNPKLLWTQCCMDRPVLSHFTGKFGVPEPSQISACSTSSACVERILTDYRNQKVAFEVERQCDPLLFQTEDKLQRELEFFTKCKEKYFGKGEKGIPCFDDSVCFGGVCDVRSGVCSISFAVLSERFVQCLESSGDTLINFNVKELLHRSNQKSIRELLKVECVPESGRFTRSHSHFARKTLIGCPECPGSECYDTNCKHHLKCEWNIWGAFKSGYCVYNWELEGPDLEGCESSPTCNWNTSLSTANSCLNPSLPKDFCGFCFSEHDCITVEMPPSKNCSGFICPLPDGGYSMSEDGNCKYCSQCSADKCEILSTEEQTCQKKNYCLDKDDIFAALDPSTGFDGMCSIAVKPFDFDPECVEQSVYLWVSGQGYSFASNQGCMMTGLPQESCPGRWIRNPNKHNNTAVLCEQEFEKGCHEPSMLVSQMLTKKNASTCESCGGSYVSTSQLVKARWASRPAYKLQSYPRAFGSAQKVSQSLDFSSVDVIYKEATMMKIKEEMLTHLQCTYNPQLYFLNLTLCFCLGQGEECKVEPTFEIGKARICSGISKRVLIPPMTLYTKNETRLSKGGGSQCGDLTVQLLPFEAYTRPLVDVSFSTSFVTSFKDHIPGTYLSVLNSQGVNVGKIVGDGIRIVANFDLESLKICLTQNTSVVEEQFTTFDFGTLDEENNVRPLGLSNITVIQQTICADISHLDYKLQKAIFPVKRIQDPESQESKIDHQSKVLFIILASSFLVVIFIVIVNFVLESSTNASRFLQEALILVSSIIRAIYFFLLAFGVFSDSETTLTYILIELPSFFYVSHALYLALVFSASLQGKKASQGSVFKLFLLLNVLIYTLFIIIIVLFSVLSGTNETISCGGRIYKLEQKPEVRVIRILYRTLLSIISFGVAMFCIVAALNLKSFVDSSQMVKNKVKLTKAFWMAFLLGISLLFNQISFLIYFIVNKPSSWIMMSILFTETLPWIAILLQLSQSSKQTTTTTTSSSASSSA